MKCEWVKNDKLVAECPYQVIVVSREFQAVLRPLPVPYVLHVLGESLA